MMLLDELTLDNLDKAQREIAEAIGLDAYKQLIRKFGGAYLYVCKEETVVKKLRDDKIREDFNGGNIRALCQRYNLSESQIRSIVNGEGLYGQMTIDELMMAR